MKIYILLTISALLTGCVSTKYLTQEPQFENELGNKRLTQSAVICSVRNDAMFEQNLPSLKLYKNSLSGKCPKGKIVSMLPVGAFIEFNKVSRTNLFLLFHTEHWFLEGSVVINNKRERFYYYWGITDCCNNTPPMWEREPKFWQ